jgi:hypothetical protein
MLKRIFGVLAVILGAIVPLTAHALMTTLVSVTDTVEQAVYDYDAGFAHAESVNVLPDSAVITQPVTFFGPVAGFVAAKSGTQDLAYLYQKVGADGQHLKFGITKTPATRYTQEELAGGKLKIVGQGSREEMLKLERNIHEALPIGPEEALKFYIQKQVQKGLKPPPY